MGGKYPGFVAHGNSLVFLAKGRVAHFCVNLDFLCSAAVSAATFGRSALLTVDLAQSATWEEGGGADAFVRLAASCVFVGCVV